MIDKKFMESLVLLLRRATGIGYELKSITSELIKQIYIIIRKKASLNETLAEINTQINEYFELVDESLASSLVNVGEVTIAANQSMKPIAVTKKLINDALNIIMPKSNMSTIDIIKRTKGVTVTSVKNYTIQAYNDGWTSRQLSEALRTTEEQLDRNLDMIARTSVNAVSNHTKMELYKKNDVNRVIFSAHLDSRTSDICKALDQEAFKIEDAPSLPLHPNERSQLVPVLKGEKLNDVYEQINPRPAVVPKNEEIYDDKGLRNAAGTIRKPSRTDRSPLKGVTTNAGDYENWLRTQPKYYQEDIIGVRATKKFREGAKLTDVINIDPLTEDQLSKAIN